MKTTGVRSKSGGMVFLFLTGDEPGRLIISGNRLRRQQQKSEIPPKLAARRVRVHVETCLESIRRPGGVRDARRVRSLVEFTWESLELYTLCADLAEDDELRSLVLQARGVIYTRLVGSGD